MTGRTAPAERTALWFRCFRPRPYAGVRLYVFPFAGSGAGMYRTWCERLPASVELRSVQLPGRQDRIDELPVTECADLVTALTDVLEADLLQGRQGEQPFAFFGHSMGALLAFEVTRELRRRGRRLPVTLGLSGWPTPRSGLPHRPYSHLSDEEFLLVLGRLGGMPDDVLGAPDLLQLVLPTVRADFTVVESHTYRHEAPLELPLSAFGGAADPFTVAGGLESWQQETSARVTARYYPGRHFYLLDQADAVAAAFVGDIRAALAGGASGSASSGASGGFGEADRW
jgi:medium-chain acyl-[acyl-carrier-protein] hydrolase